MDPYSECCPTPLYIRVIPSFKTQTHQGPSVPISFILGPCWVPGWHILPSESGVPATPPLGPLPISYRARGHQRPSLLWGSPKAQLPGQRSTCQRQVRRPCKCGPRRARDGTGGNSSRNEGDSVKNPFLTPLGILWKEALQGLEQQPRRQTDM